MRVTRTAGIILFVVLISQAAVGTALEAKRGDSLEHLVLVEGKECAICTAYLRQLKQVTLKKPLLCGRPISESFEGIEKPSRVFLSAEEIYPIYAKIKNFLRRGDQNYTWSSFNSKTGSFETVSSELPTSEKEAIEWLRRSVGTNQLKVWKFQPPIDVDNDGQVDNVVGRQHGRCNWEMRLNPLIAAVVFDEATNRILEEKSHALVALITDTSRKDWKSGRRLNSGNSLGFLQYQGEIFVDALVDLPEDLERATNTELQLFKLAPGNASLMCKFR